MKRLVFCFILLGLVCPATAQFAFHDALEIRKLIFRDDDGQFRFDIETPEKTETLFKLLVPYTEFSSGANPDQIFDAFEESGNTFITDFGEGQLFDGDLVQPDNFFSLGTPIGGLNVTNAADGLAKFIVGRLKSELSIAFFARFKKRLAEEEELKQLFPTTHRSLTAIDDEIYNVSFFLEGLRNAFVQDLNLLTVHLTDLLQDPSFIARYFPEAADSRNELLIAIQAVRQLSGMLDGIHPANAIDEVAAQVSRLEGSTNLSNSLQVLQYFSQSIQEIPAHQGGSGRKWVSANNLALLVQDSIAFKIYTGLVYQKAHQLTFEAGSSTITFGETLLSIKDDLSRLSLYVRSFARKAEIINESLSSIRESGSFEDYFLFVNATLQIIEESITLKSVLNPDIPLNQFEERFLVINHALNNLILEVRQRRYKAAVMNTVILLEQVVREDKRKSVRTNLLNYGTFIASVATAENSDEVQAAIEAAALPVGSASIKKKSTWNISINSYIGGAVGYERLRGFSDNTTFKLNPLADKSNRILAVSAPVGVAFSRGNGNASFSLFISLIDVGAITAYRIKDDEKDALPEISLKNIFSPGAHFMLGLRDVPVSLGLGAQLGPGLRKVRGDSVDIDASGFRYGFVLAVDIPLFNLYNQP